MEINEQLATAIRSVVAAASDEPADQQSIVNRENGQRLGRTIDRMLTDYYERQRNAAREYVVDRIIRMSGMAVPHNEHTNTCFGILDVLASDGRE